MLPSLPWAPLPAGRAGQGEGERLTVPARPVCDDIGDEAAVVPCGELHGAAGRPADVESVHPGVAGEDGIHQEAVAPSLGIERRVVLEPHGPSDGGRCPAPGAHGLGGHCRQPADHRTGRHSCPLAHLPARPAARTPSAAPSRAGIAPATAPPSGRTPPPRGSSPPGAPEAPRHLRRRPLLPPWRTPVYLSEFRTLSG